MTADLSRQTREAREESENRQPTAPDPTAETDARYELLLKEARKINREWRKERDRNDALAARVDALQEALREVRRDVIAAHYAGWDSERKKLAETAVDRIDAVLASAVQAEGENS